MSRFIRLMTEKTKMDKKRIVLPEGNDDRVLQAAERILQDKLAELVIIGDKKKIEASSFDLSGAEIIDAVENSYKEVLAEQLYELRRHKGVTLEDAQKLLLDPLYFGVMLVKTHHVDGMVAGAANSTRNVLSPALRILKTRPDTSMVSSFFAMALKDETLGENGMFFFGDCGLNVNPTSKELAHIAIDTAQSFQELIGATPRVALLSHSTYQSAKNDDSKKVCEAVKSAHELVPDLCLDGELQLDAALVPEVAQAKAPTSPLKGNANVLIFPDLDAGNIGYKLVQRMAHAEAFGPICQGIAAPVNDLSRGCTADDIYGVVAITCVQAQRAH